MTEQPQEPRDLIQICTDIYYECETINRLDELTDEALDWHDKQVEEVLDRLSAEVKRAHDKEGDFLEMAVDIIEAERNKLKGD